MIPSLREVALAAADVYYGKPPFTADTLVTKGQDAVMVRRPTEGTVIIAFRGTDERKDWRRNFRVGDELVHTGFQEAAEKFRDLVLFYRERVQTVVLTGHSLGGAMADYLNAVTGVPAVTFGAPRVWHKDAPVRRDATLLRLTASGDPVPHVPLLTMGFRHRWPEKLLTRRGLRERRSWWGYVKALVLGGYFGRRAHDIDRYVTLSGKIGEGLDSLMLLEPYVLSKGATDDEAI